MSSVESKSTYLGLWLILLRRGGKGDLKTRSLLTGIAFQLQRIARTAQQGGWGGGDYNRNLAVLNIPSILLPRKYYERFWRRSPQRPCRYCKVIWNASEFSIDVWKLICESAYLVVHFIGNGSSFSSCRLLQENTQWYTSQFFNGIKT